MPDLARDMALTDLLAEIPRPGITVNLASFDPGLPARLSLVDPDAQCDCACFAVQGQALPVLNAPVSFYLELTPFCNNHCPTCGNVFLDSSKRRQVGCALPPLSTSGWRQILAELQPYAHRLKLTGGEPTLHPEFETIIEEVAKTSVPFTLFTNGRWSNPQDTCALLRGAPNLEGLLVSLHGPNQAAHEAFTHTPGSFAETLSNVQMAVSTGLHVSLSCIITHHNWDRTLEMVKLAGQLGAGSVVFNRHLGPEIADLTASRQELRSAIRTISGLRAAGQPVKLGNCLPQCFEATDQAGCLAGIAFFTVDPWGRVRPCNHAPQLCGDLLRQSVDVIWQSPSLEAWRNLSPAQCRGCAALLTCRGGCRAQALFHGLDADPLMTTPLTSANNRPARVWTFYDQARPVGHFARRAEAFGLLLLSGNRLLPVGYAAQPLLDELDGRATLRHIESVHGPAGLALVATLYEQGMVELRT